MINSHQAMTEPQNAADWRGIEALVREAMALVRDLTLSRDNLTIVSLTHSTVTSLHPECSLSSCTRTHSAVTVLDLLLYTSPHSLLLQEL